MKVCLLHIVDLPEQFGGAEKVIWTLAKEFAKDTDIAFAVALNTGILSDRISSLGVKVYAMPDKGVLNVPSFFVNILKMIKDFMPDIVHSHHRYTTLLSQLLPFRRYKLIHTFHLDQFTKRWNRFFGDYATAVSNSCKEHFVKYFALKEDFITTIYNGVDLPSSDIPPVDIKRNNNEVIGSVIARLTEQKGHNVLLHAMAMLHGDVRSRFKVLFAGDGDKKESLMLETKNLNLGENVVFTGWQKDIYPYIKASDFTILPSLWEGLPLSIIESYLCGRPVIGSRVGGIPELIIDNETGLLVRPNDPSALAKAILYFMDNPALVKKFGEAGEKLALERFTVKKMADNYKAFYKKVLEENNAS